MKKAYMIPDLEIKNVQSVNSLCLDTSAPNIWDGEVSEDEDGFVL